MTVLNVPGLPGLFLACVSAAALRSVSNTEILFKNGVTSEGRHEFLNFQNGVL